MTSGLALILVRNTVSHDARVLREAEVLSGLGYDVVVAGVVSAAQPARAAEIEGKRVVRLDPSGALRRRVRPRRETGDATPPSPAVGHPATPGGDSRVSVVGAARRNALTVTYYLQGIRLLWRLAPVVVHANDYNTMWIALAAKLVRGSRVVYDSHELWPDRNGRPEWRPWLILCEALFVRAADATITTSPGYAAAIAERYRVEPPVVVRNIPARSEGPAPETASDSDPVGVYLGGLMPGRGLEQAIDALPSVPSLRLRLIGPGADRYRRALAEHARSAGVSDRVEIQDPVPPSDVLAALAGASFGLMLIQPVCRSYELTLPNKLFEYAAAGLPVLSSDLSVIGRLVREEGIGEVVPAADPERIAEGMRRLADPELRGPVRERVLAYARRETWEVERRVLERVYLNVASTP
jgi:glycosyltransferase involved in cell wall biosynthesis